MKCVSFGNTGETVSEMCLGTMMFGDRCDEAESDRIVSAALDNGVTFLDTAAMYCDGGTEKILGRILEGRRDKAFLGTKVHKGVDYESITESIDESLSRLRTDRVDLYMIHWPREGMKPSEIMRALNDVARAGKARYVGCCNYPAWLLAHSNAIAAANDWPQLVCNQIPYNPIERGVEVEVLPYAAATNVALMVYRPLLMGLLAGKYDPGKSLPTDTRAATDDRLARWLERYGDGVRHLLQLARQKGVAPAQIAIAWVRACPPMTCPIVGVSKLAQLADGLKAFEVELSDDEYTALTDAFGADVKEESGGNYAKLRRMIGLVGE